MWGLWCPRPKTASIVRNEALAGAVLCDPCHGGARHDPLRNRTARRDGAGVRIGLSAEASGDRKPVGSTGSTDGRGLSPAVFHKRGGATTAGRDAPLRSVPAARKPTCARVNRTSPEQSRTESMTRTDSGFVLYDMLWRQRITGRNRESAQGFESTDSDPVEFLGAAKQISIPLTSSIKFELQNSRLSKPRTKPVRIADRQLFLICSFDMLCPARVGIADDEDGVAGVRWVSRNGFTRSFHSGTICRQTFAGPIGPLVPAIFPCCGATARTR